MRIRFFFGGKASSFSVRARSPRISIPWARVSCCPEGNECAAAFPSGANRKLCGSKLEKPGLAIKLLPFCTMMTLSSMGVSLRSSSHKQLERKEIHESVSFRPFASENLEHLPPRLSLVLFGFWFLVCYLAMRLSACLFTCHYAH